MKKLVGLFSVGLLTLSLVACGTNNSATQDSSATKAKSESIAESSSKAKSILKSKVESSSAKASSESAEQASFDATLASETAAANAASTASSEASASQSSSEQQQPSESQTSRPKSVIHGRDEAVAAAEAKYGNNGGDWAWGCLSSDDGSYFVKAISKSSTTMTKTAMSVIVYDDGSIVQQ